MNEIDNRPLRDLGKTNKILHNVLLSPPKISQRFNDEIDLQKTFNFNSIFSKTTYKNKKKDNLLENLIPHSYYQSTNNSTYRYGNGFLRAYGIEKKLLPSFKKNKLKIKKNFFIQTEMCDNTRYNRIVNDVKKSNKNDNNSNSFKNCYISLEKGIPKSVDRIHNKLKSNVKITKLISSTKFDEKSGKSELASTDENLSTYFPYLFTFHSKPKKISPTKNMANKNFLFSKVNKFYYEKCLTPLKGYFKCKKGKEIINNRIKEDIDKEYKDKDTNKKNNVMFTEKVYTFNTLKNIRFNFPNLIERNKHQKFINNFESSKEITKF